MGKAIHRYGLIHDGDRILIGVSGGKDSLALLHLLHERRGRVPIDYELIAVHIDLGFDSGRAEILKNFFEEKGLPYHIEFTEIGKRAHSPENRENPCFLCSWERRKLTFQLAHQLKSKTLSSMFIIYDHGNICVVWRSRQRGDKTNSYWLSI